MARLYLWLPKIDVLAGQASPPLSCGQELVIGNGVIQMKTADTAHTGIVFARFFGQDLRTRLYI